MSKTSKSMILSGLVFPGLGQFVLKRYKTGVVLMITVIVSMVALINIALQRAFAILDKLQSNGSMIDLNTITNAASEASKTSDNIALWLIIACWLYGIVDAYLAGKQLDQKSPSSN